MGHNKLTSQQEGYSQDIANKKYKHHWEAYQANYNCKKMSKNAIYVEACRLIQNPKVTLRIEELEQKIKAQEKLTLDEIIIKLSKRGNLDVRGYVDDEGVFKKMSELTDDQAVFISGFKISEIWGRGDDSGNQIGRIVDVKLETFKDIMDMLIRHYGGYAKDKDVGATNLELIKEIVDGIKK